MTYIACSQRSKEELKFINYASEYAMGDNYDFLMSDPKTVQLFFATLHMSQQLLKSRIIQDENFARLLVVSCLILVTKLVSSEHLSMLYDISKKNEINLEVAIILENYILNLVDFKLNITTPDSFAFDLINLLFPLESTNNHKIIVSSEFNKVFQYIIANFENYQDYNQFIWTLVILQHSLIIHDFADESENLNEIIAALIVSEQESDDLANCFDILTSILEKSEHIDDSFNMAELHLEKDDIYHENYSFDDKIKDEAKYASHTQLNIDLLAKFNSIGGKDSIQITDCLNTSNYNSVTKASEKDNYDSTGSLTMINLNTSNQNQKLNSFTNLDLSLKKWNFSNNELKEEEYAVEEYIAPTILNAMKKRCSLSKISDCNLG